MQQHQGSLLPGLLTILIISTPRRIPTDHRSAGQECLVVVNWAIPGCCRLRNFGGTGLPLTTPAFHQMPTQEHLSDPEPLKWPYKSMGAHAPDIWPLGTKRGDI